MERQLADRGTDRMPRARVCDVWRVSLRARGPSSPPRPPASPSFRKPFDASELELPLNDVPAYPPGRGKPGNRRAGSRRSCTRRSGDRYARDWIDDPGPAIEVMRSNRHDLYLVADGRPADLAARVMRTPATGRSSCLAAHPDTMADLRAVAAGAADYIPLDELTPRHASSGAIRHALSPPAGHRAHARGDRGADQRAKSGSTCCATRTTASSRTPVTISARR